MISTDLFDCKVIGTIMQNVVCLSLLALTYIASQRKNIYYKSKQRKYHIYCNSLAGWPFLGLTNSYLNPLSSWLDHKFK